MKNSPPLCLFRFSAKQVNELIPGDVVIWNTGDGKRKKTVLRLFPTPSGNLYTVVLQDNETGKWTIQRFGAERLFGIA